MNPLHTLRSKTLRLAAPLAAIAGLLATGSVAAGSSTNNMTVQATVVSACTVSSATLNFGSSIDPLSAAVPLDASTTMTVQCTNTTPYAIALSAGVNAGGATNFGARAMASGSNLLAYQLYTDTSRSTVWGDGTASSSTVGGTGSGNNQTVTVYGRLPSLSGAKPGNYSDTVTITITY